MSDDLKVLRAVEYRVKARAAELKEQLTVLVSKIDVRDFRLVNGRVVWVVNVPPTLLTLMHQLPDALEPVDPPVTL